MSYRHPLNDDEFADLMGRLGPFPKIPRIAVAVSGGPDSMALTVLARRWVADRNGILLALTVDHGLRRESADEAAWVHTTLRALEIEHKSIAWRPTAPDRVGQSAARDARYALLTQECVKRNVMHLLLGHHRDDQAETILQRLERRTGPIGLAAMSAITVRAGVRLLRPLLSVSKRRLEQTCKHAGIHPKQDPTNIDIRYDRPGLRRVLSRGNALDASRRATDLSNAAQRAAKVALRIEEQVRNAQLSLLRVRPHGYAWINTGRLANIPPLTAEHMVARTVGAIGGSTYLRGSALSEFVIWLREGASRTRGKTVGRVYARQGWDSRGRSSVLLCREPVNLPAIDLEGQSLVRWDARISAKFPDKSFAGAKLAPLGKSRGIELRDVWGCPADVATNLPAVWRNGEIVALPQFSFHDRLEFAGNLASFECRWRPRRAVTNTVGA